MSTPTPAQLVARRMIADRGPLPDHLVRTIARRMVKADHARNATRVPA